MRKRRSRYARQHHRLGDAQELDLILGAGMGAFSTDEERREAWFRHRTEIIRNDPLAQARLDYEFPGSSDELRRDRETRHRLHDAISVGRHDIVEEWLADFKKKGNRHGN